MFEKIGQITEQEFERLRSSLRQESKLKKIMGLSSKSKYQLGDSMIVIDNAEKYGLYKQNFKGRDVFYLIANVLDEHASFAWILYPVA